MRTSKVNPQFQARSPASAGFTLIEVLLAVGLISAIVLGISQALEFSHRAAQTTEVSSDVTQKTWEMFHVLTNEETCTEMFRGAPFDPAAPEKLRINGLALGGANVIARVNRDLKTSEHGLLVRDIRFQGPALELAPIPIALAPGPKLKVKGPGVTWKHYQLRLAVELEKKVLGGAVGGGKLLKEFFLRTYVNEGGFIQGCYGTHSRIMDAAIMGASFGSNRPDVLNSRGGGYGSGGSGSFYANQAALESSTSSTSSKYSVKSVDGDSGKGRMLVTNFFREKYYNSTVELAQLQRVCVQLGGTFVEGTQPPCVFPNEEDNCKRLLGGTWDPYSTPKCRLKSDLTQNSCYWSAWAGTYGTRYLDVSGSYHWKTGEEAVCKEAHYVAGIECDYLPPGDADRCRLLCCSVQEDPGTQSYWTGLAMTKPGPTSDAAPTVTGHSRSAFSSTDCNWIGTTGGMGSLPSPALCASGNTSSGKSYLSGIRCKNTSGNLLDDSDQCEARCCRETLNPWIKALTDTIKAPEEPPTTSVQKAKWFWNANGSSNHPSYSGGMLETPWVDYQMSHWVSGGTSTGACSWTAWTGQVEDLSFPQRCPIGNYGAGIQCHAGSGGSEPVTNPITQAKDADYCRLLCCPAIPQ